MIKFFYILEIENRIRNSCNYYISIIMVNINFKSTEVKEVYECGDNGWHVKLSVFECIITNMAICKKNQCSHKTSLQ